MKGSIMPELPDVDNFRRMVERHCIDRLVSRVVVSDPASFEGSPDDAQRRLECRHLDVVLRHGKYLFLGFGEGNVIVMHFGPAGSLGRIPAGEQQPAYVRFRLDFSNGDQIAYINRRRIGRVRLVDNAESFLTQMRVGPDALDSNFDLSGFRACLIGRNRPVKLVLTDQGQISGIGNTYSDEILFHARIHPATPGGMLNAGRSGHLFRSMRTVLRTAIDLDPTTDGFRTRLPVKFLLPHRYPGGHCPRCGTELQRIKLGGHTSTYCPHCQQ
jgi:formamidopyrimidine-DNA glycosylase